MARQIHDSLIPADEFLDEWFDDDFLDAPFHMVRESPYEDEFLDGFAASSRSPGTRRRRGAAFCQQLADMANEIMEDPEAYEEMRLAQRPALGQEESPHAFAPVPVESDMILDDVESNDGLPASVRVPARSSTCPAAPSGPFPVSVVLISGEPVLDSVVLDLDSAVADLYVRAEMTLGKQLQVLVGPYGNHLDKRDLVRLSGLRSGDVITALAASSVRVSATAAAFAAIHADGSVVTWGDSAYGGDSSSVERQLAEGDTLCIYSSERAFAAVKKGGAVVTWGDEFYGGDSAIIKQHLTSDVQAIYSTASAFAALKRGGAVVSWGDLGDQLFVEQTDVRHIYTNKSAFAAVKVEGSVVTWGDEDQGGDCSTVQDELASGVVRIYSTDAAFAALKSDGSVTTWGSDKFGGDSTAVHQKLRGGVRQIFSNMAAFCALKSDGSVVTWGQMPGGGDSSHVQAQLQGNVRCVHSSRSAFAALKEDGSVVTWGFSECGGSGCSLRESIVEVPGIKTADVEIVDMHNELKRDVVQIYSTESAFAAVKGDGSLVAWGKSASGGDCSMVQKQLATGVCHVTSTSHAFAALKHNGSVVAWGGKNHGGDSYVVQGQLASNIQQICATGHAFAAIKSNGLVITWGNTSKGGADMPGAAAAAAAAAPVSPARAVSLTTVSARRPKWATMPEESEAESFDADFMRQVKEVPAAEDHSSKPPASSQKVAPAPRSEAESKPRRSKKAMLPAAGKSRTQHFRFDDTQYFRMDDDDTVATDIEEFPSQGRDTTNVLLPAVSEAEDVCSFGAWPNDVCSFGAWPNDVSSFGGEPSAHQPGLEQSVTAAESPPSAHLLQEDADDASRASPDGFESSAPTQVPLVPLGDASKQHQGQLSASRKSGRSAISSSSPSRKSAPSPSRKVDPADMQKQSDAFWESMAATLQAEEGAGITRSTNKAKTAGSTALGQTGMLAATSSANTSRTRRPPRIR